MQLTSMQANGDMKFINYVPAPEVKPPAVQQQTSQSPDRKASLIDIKGGKPVLKQKMVLLDKNSETLQGVYH